MGSTAAIVIALVAVVAGFFILRQIRDDDGDDEGSISTVATTDAATQTTSVGDSVVVTTAAPTTTGAPQIVTAGATVSVANASGVNGVAGRLTTALQGRGFTTGEALNASQTLDASVVHYDPAVAEAQAVAQSVATLMGAAAPSALPTPAPVEGGTLPEGVSVLVLLGNDKANQTLEEMGGTTAPSSTATVATVPAAGSTSTTAP